MKAGIIGSSFCAALALAAAPILGCAGSQHPDNTVSPQDTSMPASGSRTGNETGESGGTTGTESGMGANGAGSGTTTGTGTGASNPGASGTGSMGAAGSPTAGGATDATSKPIVVTLDPKSGAKMSGTATFTTGADGKVTLTVDVKGAPPGVHAIHIHQNGDCSSADAESAGPHWNPTKAQHGKWEDKDHHAGDIGNITVGADGTGTLTLTTDQWTMGTGGTNDVVGHAIVIHTKADDFTSQPAGAAGTRIGCGVITKK